MDSTFFFRVCRQELLANDVRTSESDPVVRHGVVVFFQMPIVFGGGRGLPSRGADVGVKPL
jgi:hypothetical protein